MLCEVSEGSLCIIKHLNSLTCPDAPVCNIHVMLLEKLPHMFFTVDSCNGAQIVLLSRCQPRLLEEICV